MKKLGKQAMDGKVETLLLGVLESGPGYGYQLIQDLNARAAGLLAMGEGTIYPVLHRMEERGLIAGTWREAQSGRRRKYYRMTPRGKAALARGRDQWSALVTVMEAVLGKNADPADSRTTGAAVPNAMNLVII